MIAGGPQSFHFPVHYHQPRTLRPRRPSAAHATEGGPIYCGWTWRGISCRSPTSLTKTSGWMDSPVASPSPPPSFSCVQQYPSPVPLTPSLGCSPSSTESLSGDHPMSTYVFQLEDALLDAVQHPFEAGPTHGFRCHADIQDCAAARSWTHPSPQMCGRGRMWSDERPHPTNTPPWLSTLGHRTPSIKLTSISQYTIITPNPCSSLHAFTHFPALLKFVSVTTMLERWYLSRTRVFRGSTWPTPLHLRVSSPNSPNPPLPALKSSAARRPPRPTQPAPTRPRPAPAPARALAMPITPESPRSRPTRPREGCCVEIRWVYCGNAKGRGVVNIWPKGDEIAEPADTEDVSGSSDSNSPPQSRDHSPEPDQKAEKGEQKHELSAVIQVNFLDQTNRGLAHRQVFVDEFPAAVSTAVNGTKKYMTLLSDLLPAAIENDSPIKEATDLEGTQTVAVSQPDEIKARLDSLQ
ncbi:hypothetical protein B0H14DRAFT_3492124 [Mycena olivaceomarginata]|nr:hypothetical protein B0H14DRAFT_3492124 [Mycena olivaceomarginata]